MAKTKKTRTKKNTWFYPVRGSYLPSSWQAWSLYLIACAYILTPFVIALDAEESVVSIVADFATRSVVAGIALTLIAQKKS